MSVVTAYNSNNQPIAQSGQITIVDNNQNVLRNVPGLENILKMNKVENKS